MDDASNNLDFDGHSPDNSKRSVGVLCAKLVFVATNNEEYKVLIV